MKASFLLVPMLALGAGAALASGVVVGDGVTVQLGGASLELGCGDMLVEPGGTLRAEQGIIALAGDWKGNGSFDAGTSTVAFVSGCPAPDESVISGNNTFFNLTVESDGAKSLVFESGSVTTVLNSLVLQGKPGQLLDVRSTIDGQEAFLDLVPGASQDIDYIQLEDVHSIGQMLIAFNSVFLGNTDGWQLGTVADIPTVSGVGLAILTVLLLSLGLRTLKRRHR